MSQWQSIDSAPTDGTHVLICGDYDEPCVAFFDTKCGGFWAYTVGDCEEVDFIPKGWCPIPPIDPPTAS